MYRKDEAREFASPDDVPAGEGWVDHPDKVGQAKEQPKKKAARKDGDE